MIVQNVTKDTIIGEKINLANTIFSATKGLMMTRLKESEGLIIKMSFDPYLQGIWMFGMLIPLDLIYVNKDFVVDSIYENIPPLRLSPKTWKAYYPKKAAQYAVEVPVGVIKKSKTEPGDKLVFKN